MSIIVSFEKLLEPDEAVCLNNAIANQLFCFNGKVQRQDNNNVYIELKFEE
jgi:hypothetical protein